MSDPMLLTETEKFEFVEVNYGVLDFYVHSNIIDTSCFIINMVSMPKI